MSAWRTRSPQPAQRGPGDDRLMREMAVKAYRGDLDAQCVIFDRGLEKTPRLVNLNGWQTADREDCCSTCALHLLRRVLAGAYRPERDFWPWANVVLRNQALKWVAHERRRAVTEPIQSYVLTSDDEWVPVDVPDTAPGPEDETVAHEAEDAILRELASVPREKQLPLLWRWLDTPYELIAQSLRLPVPHARVAHFRAVRLLRARLAATGYPFTTEPERSSAGEEER